MPPRPTTKINLLKYNYSSSDNLLFDTCIWLDLYGPLGRTPSIYASDHAKLSHRISEAKGKVVTHYLIIQEYFHRFMTLKKNVYNAKFACQVKDLKEYQNTPGTDFESALIEVKQNIETILSSCIVDETISPIANQVIEHLGNCGRFKPSLNDQEIIRICNEHHYFLVTTDQDFANASVAVIAADPKICR